MARTFNLPDYTSKALQFLRVNAGETGVEWSAESGLGTVTSVSVVTANGVSGTVATATTTPAITLILGAITPTSVATGTITGTSSISLGVGSTTVGSIILKNATNNFTTTIQSGVSASSRVYTWPTDFGAAASYLTDVAGNGTLSWGTLPAGFAWGGTYTGSSGTGLTLNGTSTGSPYLGDVATGSGTVYAATSSALGGGGVLSNFTHTTSGTLTANTTTQNTQATSRTYTLNSGSVTDNFIGTLFSRTSVTTQAGGTLLVQGSVVQITGVDTQTAGTLTPSYDLLLLKPGLRSTGSSINVTVPSSVVTAPTKAHVYVILGNTNTVAQNLVYIDTGSSAAAHSAMRIFGLQGGGSNNEYDGAVVINAFSGATQATATGSALSIGYNYNTNSSFFSNHIWLVNQQNAGSGANTGLRLDNYSTEMNVGGFSQGAGIYLNQQGTDGTALQLATKTNVNASTNGLINFTLNNTQSAASIIQKNNMGSSAQAHSAYYATGSNASTTAVAFNAAMATGYTGLLFNGTLNAVAKFSVDYQGICKSITIQAAGDVAGAASTTTFTNATDTTTTNTYVVGGGQAATTKNTGWTKIYIGTAVAWVPYWTNATP